jgi:hypothetical protein
MRYVQSQIDLLVVTMTEATRKIEAAKAGRQKGTAIADTSGVFCISPQKPRSPQNGMSTKH